MYKANLNLSIIMDLLVINPCSHDFLVLSSYIYNNGSRFIASSLTYWFLDGNKLL